MFRDLKFWKRDLVGEAAGVAVWSWQDRCLYGGESATKFNKRDVASRHWFPHTLAGALDTCAKWQFFGRPAGDESFFPVALTRSRILPLSLPSFKRNRLINPLSLAQLSFATELDTIVFGFAGTPLVADDR